jgi:hypothetical protein
MPINMDIKFKDGTVQNISLPVEIWKRNSEWTFEAPTKKEIVSVQLNPKGSLPDANTSNNSFRMTDSGAVAEKVDLKAYAGSFSSKQIPLKITTSVENDQLMLQATGQPKIPLEYDSNDKFLFNLAGLEFQFSKDKKSFTLHQGGKDYEFTKD